MNGYEVMAKTYRKLAEGGRLSKEEAEKQCKVLDFLASCDADDIYNLFDSGAFNDIAKEYMRLAVEEFIEEGVIDDYQGMDFRQKLNLIFDEKSAKEVSGVKSGTAIERNGLLDDAVEMYRDLRKGCRDDPAAMYARINMYCKDIAENDGWCKKLQLYNRVSELITYSIVSKYMESRDYYFDNEKNEWIKRE